MTEFILPKLIEAESVLVRDFLFSQLRLQNMKTLPWLLLVPRKADATEIYKLTMQEQSLLVDEIALTSRAVAEIYKPFKINVASLGNMVPQLHVHVVGRYENDPAWPGPIWGRLPAAPFAPDELEREKRIVNNWFEKEKA